MYPLPLLHRELTVASRRSMTLRLRMAFGGGSMLLAVWALLVSTGRASMVIFQALVWLVAILSVLTSVFVASDALSRERREGTLGFLFLTDLRPLDVILGKLAAAGLVPFYTLLGMFPAFALCQLVGGIGIALFWRAILSLGLTLLFSLCATIYVSSICEDHRKASAGSAILLIVASPLWLQVASLTSNNLNFFFTFLLFCALSFLFLGAATLRISNHWRDSETFTVPKKHEAPHRIASRLLESFPVAWMMLRRRAKMTSLRLVGMFLLLLSPFAFSWMMSRPGGASISLWLLLAAHLGYHFVMLARTAYAFYADRQNGALELFLGSCLSNDEIFEGFNRFLIRRSTPAIALLTFVDFVFAALLWRAGLLAFVPLPIAMALASWIILFGLGWLGVYRSLMMKHPSLAILATFARLSLLPTVLSLLFLNAPRTDPFKVALFYLISTGFLAVFFSLDAKAALAVHGRTLLLRPFSEKPLHIENEWSFIDWEESRSSPLPTMAVN